MSQTCKSVKFDIIGFKKPTALDKVIESIPKPKGAIPNFGLPKWKVMPLESKIPMVPGPEGAYNFTRQKIGKKLWISSADAKFNLSDPYCYEMKFSYDPLHDEHLVPFFSRRNNIQRLQNSGFITKDLYAKCSLRDYNMYRKYLRKLHCDSINKELRKRTCTLDDKSLKNTRDRAEKEERMLKKKEKEQAIKKAQEKIKLEEEARIQRWKDAAEKVNQRLQSLEDEKQEHVRLNYVNRHARYEHIRQKLKTAVFLERRKIVKTLINWSTKEKKWKKAREMRLLQEAEQKRKAIDDKWRLRQEFQKKQIEKEQFLLECMNSQRKKFIAEYDKKINREWTRIQRLSEKMKIFMKCYMARRLPDGRLRICCKSMVEDAEEIKKPSDGVRTNNGRTEIKRTKRAKQKVTEERKKADHNQSTKRKKKQSSKSIKEKSKEKRLVRKSETEEAQQDVPQETEDLPTTTTKADSATSLPKIEDKCRCQIIKATKRAHSGHPYYARK